jgi:hypothetical protein
VYAPSIGQTVSTFSEKSDLLSEFDVGVQKQQMPSIKFNLSWSHYQILMRIKDENARKFYEIEAISQYLKRVCDK